MNKWADTSIRQPEGGGFSERAQFLRLAIPSIIVALAACTLAAPALARQRWVGPGNDFMDPNAWSPAAVPGPGSALFMGASPVSIFVNGNYVGTSWGFPSWTTPQLATSINVESLFIEALDQPSRLTIANGATLTCTGQPGLSLGKLAAYNSPSGGIIFSPYGDVPATIRLVQRAALVVTQSFEVATHRQAVVSVEQASSAIFSNCDIGSSAAQFSVGQGSSLTFLSGFSAGRGPVRITNAGTVTWPTALGFPIWGTFVRPSVHNLPGGVLRFAPGQSEFFGMDVVNEGTILADQPGQTVNFGPGFSHPALSGPGIVRATNGATLVMALPWNGGATVPVLQADGPASEVRLTSGMIDGATVNTSGGGLVVGQGGWLRDVTNYGVLVARGNPYSGPGEGLRLEGIVTNLGLMRGAGSASVNYPYLGGTFWVPNGQTLVLQGGGMVDLNGGSINRWPTAAGTVHNVDNTLRGSGEIVGTMISGGAIAPGTDTATGFITVGTHLILQPSSVTRVRLGGINESDYDYIYAANTTTLAGRLEVSSLNGFVPQSDQTFDVVSSFSTAQTISGTFSQLAATGDLTGCRVLASYTPTRVRISVDCSNPCRQDFDGSGTLEPADIFDFLNAYFAGDPRTDFDNNGQRQPADIFAFLNAYFAGC
jgi:hypothetical protein